MPDACPSDAELIKSAYKTVCNMEKPLYAIGDYARALGLIASTLDDHLAAGPIARLAADIKDNSDELEEERGRLFRALHPRRCEPGFPDDGNGEVEEAAGDV